MRPYSEKYQIYPFLDLRAHTFNDGKWAANAGFGLRFKQEKNCNLWGVNMYYDYREDKGNLHQVGMGFESFTSYFDFRMNGYLPFGNKNTVLYFFHHDYLAGYFFRAKEYRRALPGANAEFETSVKKWNPNTNIDPFIALGPYFYLESHEKSIFGGQARLGMNFLRNIITLEGRVSYDNQFHAILQGLISFSIPLGKVKIEKTNNRCLANMPVILSTEVQRQEIIVNSRKKIAYDFNF